MTTTTSTATRPAVPALVAAGRWLLPVHAVLLAVGTLTHQPDPGTAFDAYARYVTTGTFLASHLGASIGGAALGVLGAVATATLLVGTRSGTTAVLGAASLVIGNVVTTAVFGAAAFAQPAIGRAQLRGVADARTVDADVYGPTLVVTAVVGLLFLLVGSVLLGVALARGGHGRAQRVAGVVYAVALPVFLVAGFTVEDLQPVAAIVAAVAAVVAVRELRR